MGIIFLRKTALVVLAEGFEEIEAVTPIDVLRRAGVEVIVAGVGQREVTGAHGITIETDIMIEQYQELPDALILPGGMPGASNLRKSQSLEVLLEKMQKEKKLIAAICASPAVVLSAQGILDGKKATCYPGFEGQLGPKVKFVSDRVVVDGCVVTSRGPGTAMEFSLELVSQLVGSEAAEKFSQTMVVKS